MTGSGRYDQPVRLSEVMRLIREMEEAAPVDSWAVDGLAVWPLVRERLVLALEDVGLAARTRRESALSDATHRAARVAAGAARRGWLAAADHRHSASVTPVDAVVLSDNVVRTWHDGGWYDEVAEPVIEAIEESGRSGLLIENERHYRAPRHRASRPVQLQLDVVKAIATVARPAQRSPVVALPGWREATAILSRYGTDPSLLGEARLAAAARHVDLLARYFARILRRGQARIGVVTSYGTVPMAFHLACRRMGIPSVEVQHGVQSDVHWAYSNWAHLPDNGYDLLPSVYWVWRDSEAETIRRWSAASRGRHRVVVGGNLWLEHWRAGSSADVAAVDRRIDALRSTSPADRHILVTLQTGAVGDEDLAALKRSIAEEPTWRWWVRMRATMAPEEIRRVREHLGPLVTVDIDNATDLPLYGLLRHMDAHVTAFSSAVIEAEAFGVVSVATSNESRILFSELFDTAWVVCADPRDVVSALHDQLSRAAVRTRVWLPPQRSAAEILDELDSAV